MIHIEIKFYENILKDLHRYHMLAVIEKDGTIFETEFNFQGNISGGKKLVPVPGEKNAG